MTDSLDNGPDFRFKSGAERIHARNRRRARTGSPMERAEQRRLSRRSEAQLDPAWMRLPIPVGGALTLASAVYWLMLYSGAPLPELDVTHLGFYAMMTTVLGPLLLLWGLVRWRQKRLFEALATQGDDQLDLEAYRVPQDDAQEEHVLDFAQHEVTERR